MSTQLNVNPVDSTGAPILGAIITVGLMDATGRPQPFEPAIRVQSNFWIGPPYTLGTAPYQVYGTVQAAGYRTAYFGPTVPLWDGISSLNIPVTLSFSRPAATLHDPLQAWDASNPDGSGIVHTVPPTPFYLPPHFSDPAFLRADFNGITLDLIRWNFDTPPVGRTLFDIIGANSTPAAMLMSPMLILYPRKAQDAWLTESAERGYDDVVIASSGWNLAENGFTMTPAALVQWAQYLRSWGNRIVYWGNLSMNDPYLQALLAAGCVQFHVVGEEVNTKVDPATLETILQNNLAISGGSIPHGVHFTDDYPLGFPLDTYLTNWAPYDGKVHLCWQANQNDTAGTQGGKLYYARQRVNLGFQGDGTILPQNAAPNSRVILFEMMATAQLFGQCSESYGNLRTLETLYCPVDNPQVRPLSGYCNGGRLHAGGAL
jgi:hypothetical protein